MTKDRKQFLEDLFKVCDPDDMKGITNFVKKFIKDSPGKICNVPSELRTDEICQHLIKVAGSYNRVRKFIPPQIRERFENNELAMPKLRVNTKIKKMTKTSK